MATGSEADVDLVAAEELVNVYIPPEYGACTPDDASRRPPSNAVPRRRRGSFACEPDIDATTTPTKVARTDSDLPSTSRRALQFDKDDSTEDNDTHTLDISVIRDLQACYDNNNNDDAVQRRRQLCVPLEGPVGSRFDAASTLYDAYIVLLYEYVKDLDEQSPHTPVDMHLYHMCLYLINLGADTAVTRLGWLKRFMQGTPSPVMSMHAIEQSFNAVSGAPTPPLRSAAFAAFFDLRFLAHVTTPETMSIVSVRDGYTKGRGATYEGKHVSIKPMIVRVATVRQLSDGMVYSASVSDTAAILFEIRRMLSDTDQKQIQVVGELQISFVKAALHMCSLTNKESPFSPIMLERLDPMQHYYINTSAIHVYEKNGVFFMKAYTNVIQMEHARVGVLAVPQDTALLV